MPAHPDSGNYTGNARFRHGWLGKLVLQVEKTVYKADDTIAGPTTRWEDAEDHDLPRIREKRKAKGMEPLL